MLFSPCFFPISGLPDLPDRFDAQALSSALSIAWGLLIAADHPVTQGASASEVRKRMENRIRLSAQTAIDEDDLWAAALSEVEFAPRSARSPTAHLAKICEMSAAVA
jgi:hypothetical protein